MTRVSERALCDGLRAGPLEIDAEAGCACLDDRAVMLTATELRILLVLARHEGAVVPKTRLMREARFAPVIGFRDRRVDVHVSNIRAKLAELAPGWTFIHTHVGVGYRFDAGVCD